LQDTQIRVSDFNLASIGAAKQIQVAAIAFSPNGGRLNVAYAPIPSGKTSEIVEISLPGMQDVSHLELGALTVGLTKFSKDTNHIVTVTRVNCEKKDVSCWQPQVWELSNGRLVSARREPLTDITDIEFSSDGSLLLSSGTIAAILDPRKDAGGSALILSDEDHSRDILTMAINMTGEIISYGVRDRSFTTGKTSGAIGFRKWNGQQMEPLPILRIGEFEIYRAEQFLQEVPLKTAISPNDRWVAFETENLIGVTGLTDLTFSKSASLESSARMTTGLDFSADSSLLAASHSKGISIYQVPELTLLMSKASPVPTSIAFSPDGCLFAWGDVEGTVHIINAPNP
jgi:WD40 repeat protein